MTESESTGTRPVLPRLNVPRRADLEDFDLAVRRAMDAYGCTWAEAFEVLRPVVPLAVRQGARFYCGSGESRGTPVTSLSPPRLCERLEQMADALYEYDLDARYNPPPVLASLGDLELLLKLAFDPTVPIPPEAVTHNSVAPWAERFPTWGRRVRVTLAQAALLLANIDPVTVSHSVSTAKIGNWGGWEEAEGWAGAIADAIKSGRLSPDADGEIAVADLLRWIDETTAPAPKPDAADFWLDSPDLIAEARAEALQAAQERDQARARADMLEQEKDTLLGELEALRERLSESERSQHQQQQYDQPLNTTDIDRFLHFTELLKLVAAVQERYWGPNWDRSDRDTAPRQKEIVGWLKSAHRLTDNEATSVERIACPINRNPAKQDPAGN